VVVPDERAAAEGADHRISWVDNGCHLVRT
jgi:hypothetical protein